MSTRYRRRGYRIFLLAVLSVTIGAVVLTGSVAADFKVDIVEWNETVESGGNLTVVANITNTGPTESQKIELIDPETETTVNQTSRTIPNGNTEPITLTWLDVPRRNDPIYPTIKTQDDVDKEETTVLWSDFAVQNVSVNRSSLSAFNNEQITINAKIKNIGTEVGTQDIILNNSSGTIRTKPDVTLTGGLDNTGESTEVAFKHITPPVGDSTYTVGTANETSDGIAVTANGGFNVEIDDTRTDGTNLTVDATFSKLGEHTDTQNISFEVEGQSVQFKKDGAVVKASQQETVTVDGTAETVSFTYDTGSLTFTKNVSITTERPDIATATITKTDNRNLGPGNFKVKINSASDSSVSANGNLSIYADITNTGQYNATQTVQLVDNNGNVQQQKEVLINKGNTKTVELVWKSVPGSEREVLPTIESQNDSATVDKYIPVLSSQFEIRKVTVDKQSGRVNTNFKFDVTVRNTGTKRGSQYISLVAPDGTLLKKKSLPIDEKEQIKRDNYFTVTAPSSPGKYQYTVKTETPGASATQSITVGAFTVEITDWTVVGTSVQIDATVSKIGSYTDTQTVKLTVDGTVPPSKPSDPVTLEGTTPERISFSPKITGGFPKTIRVKAPRDTDVVKIAKAKIKSGPTINSVADDIVQSGDTLEFTYTADGPNVDSVTLSLVGPRGDVVASKPLTPGVRKEGSINIPGRDEALDGSYVMRLRVANDFGGRVSAIKKGAFTVSNAINPEAIGKLGKPVIRSPAGDFVSIPTGGEYMIIGGDKRGGERTQFLDILHVSGGSTVVNTRLLGTEVSSSRAYGDGVTSYAHSIGADAGPKEREGTPFEGVSFTTKGVSSLAGLREKLSIDARRAPLQAGRYQLVAGENGRIQIRNGAPDFTRPVGRSNLILTQTQRIGNITTYVAPPAPADATEGQLPQEAVKSSTVAIGERLIIEVPATGMWGATLPDSESKLNTTLIANLLEKHEGVHIEFDTKRTGDPNNAGGELQFESVSKSDISVSKTTGDLWKNKTVTGAQPIIGGYYIVIDTRGVKPFDTQPDPGSVLEFEMAYESPAGSSYRFNNYNFDDGEQPDPFDPAVTLQDGDEPDTIEHYPYFGDDDTTVESNATVRFIEPSITYARTRPDGSLIVPAENGGKIIGSTTMAPGSQVTIRLLSGDGPNPDLVKIVETTVNDDRTFSASADFSTLQPGQNVEVEFASQNRLSGNRVIDSRNAYVVDNFENPARFRITSFPGSIEVRQRESLDEIEATITNNGSIAGRQVVEFRIGGEPVRNESITIGGGGSKTLDLSGQFVTLPTGTYQYTIRTDDDTRTGQLTVTAPDTGTAITDATSQGATASSPVSDGGGTGGTGGGSEPSGLFSLVGVRTRDVAVATAIAGLTHVLGYWT